MVTAPSYWFRDTVTHTVPGRRDGTRRLPGVSQTLRCKFRGAALSRWEDGIETRSGSAYFLMPKLPPVIRTVTRIDEVVVSPRNVGDRLPSLAFPYPDISLFPEGQDIFRADYVTRTETYEALTVHPGDHITYRNTTYTVERSEEYDGWNGPSHIKVILRDR